MGIQRCLSSELAASTVQTRVMAATPPLRWTVIFMVNGFHCSGVCC
jgi:hypothetical protein